MTKIPAVVILISGRGSNMRAIIDACAKGEIQAKVVKVISNRADALGLEYAAAQGIETKVLSHKEYASRDEFDKILGDEIAQKSPDIICLAGFMRILTAGFVERFKGKILNIHPSLLPKYKGLDTHQRAIDAGDHEAGCSVHVVTSELDGGPVVAQTKVPIEAGEAAQSLADKVLAVEHQTYVMALEQYLSKQAK